jgi:hypothetical protein
MVEPRKSADKGYNDVEDFMAFIVLVVTCSR